MLGKRIAGKGMIQERHPRLRHDHADVGDAVPVIIEGQEVGRIPVAALLPG
jgi:hypothetical protein